MEIKVNNGGHKNGDRVARGYLLPVSGVNPVAVLTSMWYGVGIIKINDHKRRDSTNVRDQK